jgi:hypothetical protein
MKTDFRVAIGPVARFPSWQWVGEDTGKELTKYFHVTFFETGQIPDADVALVIKHLPTLQFVNRIKTIYCPIDFFSFEASIGQQAKILEKCALVLSHSYRLVPLLAKYCATKPIDHHLKFKTREIPEYKKEGFVLWAGGFESSPYFLQWLDTHPLPHPVRLLTNYKDKNAVMAGVALADKLKTKARQESTSGIYSICPANTGPLTHSFSHHWRGCLLCDERHDAALSDSDIHYSEACQYHKQGTGRT